MAETVLRKSKETPDGTIRHHSKCNACGRMVYDDCFVAADKGDFCISCAKKTPERPHRRTDAGNAENAGRFHRRAAGNGVIVMAGLLDFMTDKQYLFTSKDGKGYICGDTVNKFLRENAKRCGITRYADSKTGVHCIRKMHAQEVYRAARESGMSHKQALWEVMLDLRHSSIRMEVLEAYLNTDFEGD